MRSTRPGASYDARTVILAAVFVGDAVFAGVLTAASSGVSALLRGPVLTTTLALVVTGAWVLSRRRLSDAGCAVALTAFLVVATANVLGFDSANLRWASVYGLTGIPLITLMIASLRWAAVVSATCLAAQVSIVASISATPVEAVASMAILCIVLPLVIGNTAMLLRRSEALRLAAARAAEVDPLTGLLNRRGLTERWSALLRSTEASGGSIAVLLIDVDHFKVVNDTHGHDAGDGVLAALAAHLLEEAGSDDLVVRLGGEEFAVIGVHADAEAARSTAERLRTSVSAVPDGSLVPFTISIGVSSAEARLPGERLTTGSQESEVLSSLLTQADHALYAAKAAGRDRVAVAGRQLAPRVLDAAQPPRAPALRRS